MHQAYQSSSCQHSRAIAVVSIASGEDQRAFPGLFSVYRDPSNRYLPILSDGLKYFYKIKSVASLHQTCRFSSCQHWGAIGVVWGASEKIYESDSKLELRFKKNQVPE